MNKTIGKYNFNYKPPIAAKMMFERTKKMEQKEDRLSQSLQKKRGDKKRIALTNEQQKALRKDLK